MIQVGSKVICKFMKPTYGDKCIIGKIYEVERINKIVNIWVQLKNHPNEFELECFELVPEVQYEHVNYGLP